MIGVPFESAQDESNPLDLVEEIAEAKNWRLTRHSDDNLGMSMPCAQGMLDVAMEWQEEFSALLIACSLPLPISEHYSEMTIQALERINQNLWLGHFDLSGPNKSPTFRHTLLLRMVPANTAFDLIADTLDLAAAECNRFFSTFRRAQEGDIRLHDDLNAAVFETIGEA